MLGILAGRVTEICGAVMFTGPALTGSELLTDHMVTESAELTEVMANEMYLPR